MKTFTVTLTDDQIKDLVKKAERSTGSEASEEDEEEFNPDDRYGGNADDCYAAGERDGETYAAREFLTHLGISFS